MDDIDILKLANHLLSQLTVPRRVDRLGDINAAFFVTLFEALCGDEIPDVVREPKCEEDEIHNAQCVIDSLALDVLHTSLSHISGQDIVKARRETVINLLDIFSGLLEYILDGIAQEDDEHNKGQAVVQDNGAGRLGPQIFPQSSNEEKAGVSSEENTEELIALGNEHWSKQRQSPTASPSSKKSRSTSRRESGGERRQSQRVTPQIVSQPIASSSMQSLVPSDTNLDTSARSSSASGPIARKQIGYTANRDTTFTKPGPPVAHRKPTEDTQKPRDNTSTAFTRTRDIPGSVVTRLIDEAAEPNSKLLREHASQTSAGQPLTASVDSKKVSAEEDLSSSESRQDDQSVSKFKINPNALPMKSWQKQPKRHVSFISERCSSEASVTSDEPHEGRAHQLPKDSADAQPSLHSDLREYFERKEAGGDVGDARASTEARSALYERLASLRRSASTMLDSLRGDTILASSTHGGPLTYRSEYARDRALAGEVDKGPESTTPSALQEHKSLSSESVSYRTAQPGATLTEPYISVDSHPRDDWRLANASVQVSKATAKQQPSTTKVTFSDKRSTEPQIDPVVKVSREYRSALHSTGSDFRTAPHSTGLDHRIVPYSEGSDYRPAAYSLSSEYKTALHSSELDYQTADRTSGCRKGLYSDGFEYTTASKAIGSDYRTASATAPSDYHTAPLATTTRHQKSHIGTMPVPIRTYSDIISSDKASVGQEEKPAGSPTQAWPEEDRRTRETPNVPAPAGSDARPRRVRFNRTGSPKATPEAMTLAEALDYEQRRDEKRQMLLTRMYRDDLADMTDLYQEQLEDEKRLARDQDQSFAERVKRLHEAYSKTEKKPSLKPATKPKGFLLEKTRVVKKKPSKRERVRSDEAVNASRKPLDPNSENFLPSLMDEFPHMYLAPETLQKMWSDHRQQSAAIKKCMEEEKRKKSQAKVTIEEAGKRQAVLMKIMSKDLEHTRRMKQLKDKENADTEQKRREREKRGMSARVKKYYDNYAIRMRSSMLKNKTREEQLFRRLFAEALKVQKERMRELRSFTQEHRQIRSKKQQQEVEALENFYKDQFAMLAENVVEQRRNVEIRDVAQANVLQKMKKELRMKMEQDINNFQEQLKRDEDDYYFRQLDAERVVQQLNMTRYQTGL